MKSFYQYLPISRANLEWDLYVTGMGSADFAPGDPYPHEGHPGTYDFTWEKGRVLPEYQVVYISRGEGLFESAETGQFKVGSGHALLLFPGHWHRYKPAAATGWREHWLSWNGEYLYRLARRGHIGPESAVLPVSESDAVLALYDRIQDLIAAHPGENSRVLAAIGMELLAVVLESAGEKPVQRAARRLREKHGLEDKVVADALQSSWTHSYRVSTVDSLVDRLPVTRRTLERRFRQALGRSVAQEITESRLSRAKHLLANTKLPVEHIALAVGFSGSARMGKVFQAHEQATPREYRRKRGKV